MSQTELYPACPVAPADGTGVEFSPRLPYGMKLQLLLHWG